MDFSSFHFHEALAESLEASGYQKPTPIQEKAIPIILEGKDIIASAQTGTGKTAAFLLPILHKLLSEEKNDTNVHALILVPTRELAIQISSHLDGLTYFTSLSSIAVYYGVLLAYELSRAKARLWRLSSAPNLAGLLLVAYPSGLFYGGQLLKDPAVLALGMASLYWSAKLLWKPRLRETIFLVIGLVGLYQFRGYASVALLGALSVYALTQIWRRPLYVALVALIAVLVPIALGWGPLGLKYLAPLLNPEKISHIREEVYSIGGSAVDISLDFSNPIAFLISYAYSFATVLLGPLPWQVKSPIVAIALVEAVPMWFLLATVWLRNSFRCADRRATFLVIFVLIYIGGLALISDNIGANTRLRLLPWSTLLVWIALQLEIQLERRRKHAPPLPHHSR